MARMILVVSMVLVFAPAARAQNVLVNGDFETDVSGWNASFEGIFTWDAGLDADDDPDSGVGLFQNVSPAVSGTAFASQCVPVNGGDDYDVGAEIYFDSNLQAPNANGYAKVLVHFKDAESCGGILVGVIGTQNVPATNLDTWVLTEELNFTAPVTAVTAQFSLWTNRVDPNLPLAVHFDNAVLAPAPEPGAAALVSVALLTLGWLRRGKPDPR